MKKKRHLKKWVKILLLSLFCLSVILIVKNNNYLKPSINKIESDNLIEKLEKMASLDNRVDDIIKNIDAYPRDLLEMLSRNSEMIDFVSEYPEKYGKVYSGRIDNYTKGEIPLLLQWDKRWGYAKYGDSTIAVSGCGPTALSMVIIGLTGNTEITPYKVATFAYENGYYVDGVGTSWSLMSEGASSFHIKSEEIPLDKNIIIDRLKNKNYIICSMRPGDFTTEGHFIVLTGVSDGKIQIHDPNSKKNSNTLWSYDKLASQIKNLWAFSSL